MWRRARQRSSEEALLQDRISGRSLGGVVSDMREATACANDGCGDRYCEGGRLLTGRRRRRRRGG